MRDPKILWTKLCLLAATVVMFATEAPPSDKVVEEKPSPRTVDLGVASSQVFTLVVGSTKGRFEVARGGGVSAAVEADRAASDLTLSLRRTAPAQALVPRPPDGETLINVHTASPNLQTPDQARVSLELFCASQEWNPDREAACADEFELEVTRQSAQPLELKLSISAGVAVPIDSDADSDLTLLITPAEPSE